MKKQILYFANTKRYLLPIFASLILTATSYKAVAFQNTDTGRIAFVEYQGLKNNLTSFKVHFDNTYSKRFELCLEDEHGETLYSRIFTASALNKEILVKNVGDNFQYKLNFIIKAGKKKFEQVFDINTKRTLINEMVVTRL